MIDDLLRQSCNGDLAELLASVIQYTQDGIITIDENQTVVMYNNGAKDIFEYDHDEVLGKSLTMLLPQRVKDIHHHHVHSFDESHSHGGQESLVPACDRKQLAGVTKSGVEFPCEVSISKTEFKGNTYFTAIIRDITERCKNEKRLHKQAKKLEKYKTTRKAKLLDEVIQVAHNI